MSAFSESHMLCSCNKSNTKHSCKTAESFRCTCRKLDETTWNWDTKLFSGHLSNNKCCHFSC